MPCAFTHWRNSTQCQFNLPESELVEFNNARWCKFHLPVKNGEQRSEKAYWSIETKRRFAGEITRKLINCYRTNLMADLTGVIFPTGWRFEPKLKNWPDVCFLNSQFNGGAVFDQTVFKTAIFSGSTFDRLCSFVDATFMDEVIFEDANFVAGVEFDRAGFRMRVSFLNARFCDHMSFTAALFEGHSDFSWQKRDRDSGKFPKLSFRGACFCGGVCFNNRFFSGDADFRRATFMVAPEFYGCVLHQDTSFTGTRFLDHSEPTVDAVRAYRVLRIAMKEIRATKEETLFFRLEQRNLREQKEMPWNTRVLSWLYDATAAYGDSIVRPIGWFCGTFLLFTLLHLGIITANQQLVTIGHFTEALRLTLEQVFKPFSVFNSEPPVALGILILSVIHSLLNFSFLALLLIALRRKFKFE